MSTISTYTLTLEDIEEFANIGRGVTLAYLVNHGYLTEAQAREVSGSLAILAKKPSWFEKLLTARFCCFFE